MHTAVRSPAPRDGPVARRSSSSRAVTARASSSSPSSTSASTSSGATGNAPGSRTPARSVWSHTHRSHSAAAPASCTSSSAIASARRASSSSQRTPLAWRARIRLRPPAPCLIREPAAGAEESPAPLVHRPVEQFAVGGLRPLVEPALRSVPLPRAQLELAQVQPLQGVRRGLTAFVRLRELPAEDVSRLRDLARARRAAAPQSAPVRTRCRTGWATLRETAPHVLDRAAAEAARPGERVQRAPFEIRLGAGARRGAPRGPRLRPRRCAQRGRRRRFRPCPRAPTHAHACRCRSRQAPVPGTAGCRRSR